MLVNEMIARAVAQYSDCPAVLFDGQSRSFAQVASDADRIAKVLRQSYGLRPGDAVGLLASNGLFSISLDFGCARARLMRVPLNARLSVTEQVGMLARMGTQILLHTHDLKGRADDLAAALPGLTIASVEDDLLGADTPDIILEAAKADDPILALYTSGTTGVLKAAVHTHGTYSAVVRNILLNLIQPRPGDVMLHAASLIHASGTFVVPYWVRGGASAVLPGFSPPDYLKAVEQTGATALNLVPTMISMLLETPGIDAADFSRVRDIIYGTAPMPRPVLKRAIDTFGPKFSQFYGQTEVPLCITVLDKTDHADETTWSACGRPSLDVEIRLLDDAGAEVPPGEAGEIAVRSPVVMRGYHDADDLNAAAFTPDGFNRTRDIGRFDDRGLLYLIDRASDMIVTGGYNVYPREVEDVLVAHPAVVEAVAVGLPDDKWGETPCAFVTLKDGAQASEAEVMAYCKANMAGFKSPKTIVFGPLPKTSTGKIQKFILRDMARNL